MPRKLTDQVISAAIDGFVAQKARLDQQIAELRAMLPSNTNGAATVPELKPTNHRKFSAAARRRMREAQRLRWSKIRGETIAPPHRTARPKRRISEQGLKNIIAATKRRWALRRLEAAKAKKAASTHKKAAPRKVARKKTA